MSDKGFDGIFDTFFWVSKVFEFFVFCFVVPVLLFVAGTEVSCVVEIIEQDDVIFGYAVLAYAC